MMFCIWDYESNKYKESRDDFKTWVKFRERCADCHNERYADLMNEWVELELKNQKSDSVTFVLDGIVNPEVWEKQEKKVLFILKEAYDKTEKTQPGLYAWDEPEYIWKENARHNENTWRRVYQWAKKALNPTLSNDEILKSQNFHEDFRATFEKFAVINVKKTDGISRSDNEDLEKHAYRHAGQLIEQIEIINPDVIICGGTCRLLDIALQECNKPIVRAEKNESWNYTTNAFNNRPITVVDFWHPAWWGRADVDLLDALEIKSIREENFYKHN